MILIDRFQKEDARIEFHVEFVVVNADDRQSSHLPLLPPIENRNAVKVGRGIGRFLVTLIYSIN